MAILDKWTLDFTSSSAGQTERLGVRLGELLQAGDVVCLAGELGMGKTTLARGIGRGWGTAVRVTSPSYVIVNQYPRARDGRLLYHIDGYRLESEADAVTVGLEDILDDDAAIMVEWPERIDHWLPADRFNIHLEYVNATRRSLRFTAGGARSRALFEQFKHSAFGI